MCCSVPPPPPFFWQVPDYLTVVSEPMDLSLIKHRVDTGYYASHEELRADLNLMVSNCKLYNDASTVFYKEAETLQAFIDRIFTGRGTRNQ